MNRHTGYAPTFAPSSQGLLDEALFGAESESPSPSIDEPGEITSHGIVCDASGNYELASVAPGLYEIRHPGREEERRTATPAVEMLVETGFPLGSDTCDTPGLPTWEASVSPWSTDEIALPPWLVEEPPAGLGLEAGQQETLILPAESLPAPLPMEEEPPPAERLPLVLEACTGLTLAPGEAAVLTLAMLRITGAPSPFLIDILLLSPPVCGALLRDGFALTGGDVFTQEDVDHGRIQYRHDPGMPETRDSFTFATPEGEVPAQKFEITLLSARRAPELAGCGNLSGILEGCRAADVLAGTVRGTDIEPGLAVVSTTGRGRWEFSLDGGASWQALPASVSNGCALLLGPMNLIRFVPAAGWSGAVRLSYRAWDRSTGCSGETVDLSGGQTCGGSGAFSMDVATATSTVSSTTAPPLGTWTEPWQGSLTAYELVGSGLAAVRLEGAGTWQFSLDDGRSWQDIGPVFHGRALLLPDGGRLRFLPRRHGSGKVVLGVRTWDGTGGTPGSRVNLTSRQSSGEGTPFGEFVQTRSWRLGGE